MANGTVTDERGMDDVVYPHLYQFDHTRGGMMYVAFTPEEAVELAENEGFSFTTGDIVATKAKSRHGSREP